MAFVGIRRTPDEITLEVKDKGKGIPQEVQGRISSGESAGVGFRGMRERIRQFGGRMQINSDLNGTRIVTILPSPGTVTVSDPESMSIARTASPSDAEKLEQAVATILCIDDEAAGLMTRKLLLESAGHRVIEARSGPEGIQLFRSSKVDAVILDYWMAGMKGTAVASELKRINPAVPIIVLSGMSDLPGEAAGLVDQWIIKGTTRAEELLNSIHGLLQRRPA